MWWYVALFYALLPIAFATAWRWGAWPERSVSSVYLVAAVLTVLLRSGTRTKYHDIEIAVLVIDTTMLIALVAIALKADRWWTLWAAALQVITLTGHMAKILEPSMSRLAYALMLGASSYPTLFALLIGVWRHRAREHRNAEPFYRP